MGADRSDLAAGVYNFTVTDNAGSGCTLEQTFTLINEVTGGANINITNEPIMVSCVGAADAVVNFTINFSPDFVGPETTAIIDAAGNIVNNGFLAAGTYCLIVTDGNDCMAGQSCFEVTEPSLIDVDVMFTNADCNNPGVITLDVTGGNGDYTFDWEDVPGTNNPQDRDSLLAGMYNLTITDINGCTAVANNINVADDCLSCPSSATVYMTMDIEDQFIQCIELEDCFDETQTNISLFDGTTNGSSAYGTWSLDANGCLTYESLILEGEFIDTVCVVADFDGLLDTTCIVVTISSMPLGCPNIIIDEAVSLTVFECFEFGFYCLPIDPPNLFNYQILDNG